MSRAKNIIEGFVDESGTGIIGVLNKMHSLDDQKKKEYEANGQSKKFYSLHIEYHKAMITVEKDKLEKHLSDGGVKGDKISKAITEYIKDIQDDLKKFEILMKKATK